MVDVGQCVNAVKTHVQKPVLKCQVDGNKGIGCAPVFFEETIAKVNAMLFFRESGITNKGAVQANAYSPARPVLLGNFFLNVDISFMAAALSRVLPAEMNFIASGSLRSSV